MESIPQYPPPLIPIHENSAVKTVKTEFKFELEHCDEASSKEFQSQQYNMFPGKEDKKMEAYLHKCSSDEFVCQPPEIIPQVNVPLRASQLENDTNMFFPPQTEAEYYWYQKSFASQKKIARLTQKVFKLRKMLRIKVAHTQALELQQLPNQEISKQNEVFKCNTCQKEYKSKGSLQIHLPKHDHTKWKRCQLCNYTTPYSSNLTSHVKKKHAAVFYS